MVSPIVSQGLASWVMNSVGGLVIASARTPSPFALPLHAMKGIGKTPGLVSVNGSAPRPFRQGVVSGNVTDTSSSIGRSARVTG